MNGFPLVLLGVVLFVVGYAILKIQGKMKEITGAIDSGFKTIEDGITDNLLGSNGALTQAKSAVEQSYLTIKTGVDENVLGSTGLLSKTRYVMNYANTICIGVGDDVHQGKLILQNDIRKTTGDIEVILQKSGVPLINAGVWLTNIGNGIDIDIAGAHPFYDLAKPFRDTGKVVDDIGDLCLDAKAKLIIADQKIMQAESALEDISLKAKALGAEIINVSNYVNTSFTTGINASMNNLKQVTDSAKTLFVAMESGAQVSVTNLEKANNYLNSLLNNIFNRQLIVGLFSAGIIMILAGVALGL
jgi:hypothetical protein